MNKRRVIGLTGGMGSGKSSVAEFLAGGNTPIISLDADAVCRELLAPGANGWLAFQHEFGTKYLNSDGTVNRKRLRKSIFKESAIRTRLNRLLHPLARMEIQRRITAETLANPNRICLVEVALLFEAHWQMDFDRIVVVYADRETCIHRLMTRDQISRNEAEQGIAAQMPLWRKALSADHVVDNSLCWPSTWVDLLRLRRLFVSF